MWKIKCIKTGAADEDAGGPSPQPPYYDQETELRPSLKGLLKSDGMYAKSMEAPFNF